MGLEMRWVGEGDLDRVAETRVLCYAHHRRDLPEWRQYIYNQGRSHPGDYLLAERDGRAVGTATSLRMTMWVRGSPVSCQGVAHVGTIKTERRKGAASEDGVGTLLMREVLRMGREREHVISGLMPWRASYYEHFGYGLVERRAEWTIPLTLMPQEDCAGLRFMTNADKPAMAETRRRFEVRGQGNIQRCEGYWADYFLRKVEDGFIVVDPRPEGGLRGWMFYKHEIINGKDGLRVLDLDYDDAEALRRQLSFLSSLRDQYSTAMLILPVDLPLNLLLKETQVPHRPVSHAVADLKLHTRMQARVLDHVKLLSAMNIPSRWKGSAVVEVRETEGHAARFRIDIAEGKASAKASNASADLLCSDKVWAAIVLGELAVATAVK
ncbi:MAG TPA: GNAT family N-acetyltransferase, partial [Tepidisphaeraceae bacterium]|nr:GNAT family N-acetyltransferase [Tepidisphaeraceae bacterium]